MEDLIKRLRELHPEEFGNQWDFAYACQQVMHEAADAIEELMRRCEQFQYMPPPAWISVDEQLPKKPEGYPKCEIRRTYYLVALKSGCVKALGYEFDRNEWQITGSPVVAWMPLPKPPKEE